MAHDLSGLMKWVNREGWREPFAELLALHVEAACETANVAVEELPDLLGEHHSNNLYGCVFEDFLTHEMDDGANIVDDYLKRRGWKESARTRAYLTALRTSVMSLYEVSDIVRDQSFLARDLLRGGEPIRVHERSGTRYLKPWDRIAARIVRVGDRVQMAGGSLAFRHKASEELLRAFRNEARAGSRRSRKRESRDNSAAPGAAPAEVLADTETLRDAAAIFTLAWLRDVLARVLHPQLPQLCNTDGEPVAFTRVTFPLNPPPQRNAVASALNGLTCMRPEDDAFWNWIETRKPARPGKLAEGSVVIVSRLDDGSKTLGTIELTDATLILEANSRERAARGQALIEQTLTTLIGQPAIESIDAGDTLMASSSDSEPESAEERSTLTPDEERAIAHAFIDKHYADLLDQPVPALGDVSPRRASRTVKGREKVVSWLKQMENTAANGDAGSPMASYDHAWLWKALGVADLRR